MYRALDLEASTAWFSNRLRTPVRDHGDAITHNLAQDAWVTGETGNEGAGSWLRVSNCGPQVPELTISKIFEPFRRMDGERAATTTGLDLSIVRAIADVHGAAVERPVR